MDSSDVPAIDLQVINVSEAFLADPANKRKTMEMFVECFSTVGFCLITGLEDYDTDALLRWTKWFHCQVPEDIKLEQLATRGFNPKNSNLYRGYFPLVEGSLSYKQGYDLGPDFSDEALQEGNPFRQKTPRLCMPGREDELKTFYEVMYNHHDILSKKGSLIMSLIAEAGGEDSDYFGNMFTEFPLHTLRPLRYPKRVSNIPKGAYLPDGRIISTPAHQDSGFLTLLNTFGYPGLEIEVDSVWYRVPPVEPDTLVVNLGEQVTAMSNRRFKATIHRVLDIGEDRFSLPFFFEPNLDANINMKLPRGLLPPEETARADSEGGGDYYPFGAFLLNKLPIYAEYAKLCDCLPKWMRERYLAYGKPRNCWATENGIEVDGLSYDSRKTKEGFEAAA